MVRNKMGNEKKPRGYWTLENLLKDAEKFLCRYDWSQNSPSAYTIACKKGLVEYCCKNMKNGGYTHFNRSNEQIFSSAKKFKSRSAWMKAFPNDVNIARKRDIYDDCCKHMEYLGNHNRRMIYVYEFKDNSVYVGLTYNESIRKHQHLFCKKSKFKSQVYIHYKKIKTKPKYIKITNGYVDSVEAQKIEKDLIEKYKKEGWNILNKAKAGGLGGGIIKWTKEKCIEDAKKYLSKNEWVKKSSGAVGAAKKNGWFEKSCKHMKELIKPKGYWTREKCIKVALKCKTQNEFGKTYKSAYGAARKNKWIKECCKHMVEIKKPNHYWTKKRCFKEALKYKSKSEFKNKCGGAFLAVRTNGWLKELTEMMPEILKPKGYWTKEKCMESAKKCNTKSIWQTNYSRAYATSKENGWFDECCKHMIQIHKPHGYWKNNKDRCIQEAKKYKSKKEFRIKASCPYTICRINGWLKDIKLKGN